MATQRGRGKPKRYEGEDSTRLSVLIRPRYREALEIIARDRQSTISEAMELCIAKLASEYTINDSNLLAQIMPELNFVINFDTYVDKCDLPAILLSLTELMDIYVTCSDGDFSSLAEALENFNDTPLLSISYLKFLYENIELFLYSECYKVSSYNSSLRTPKENFQIDLLEALAMDIPINQVNFFWELFGEFYNTGFSFDSAVAKVDKHASRAESKYNSDTLTWNLSSLILIDKYNRHFVTLDLYLEMISVIVTLIEIDNSK